MRMRGFVVTALAAWMFLIIAFSSQPADQSSITSRKVVKAIVDAITVVLPIAETPWEKVLLAAQLHNLVRKVAHMFNYFVLGCLAYWTFRLFEKRNRLRRVLLSAAFLCIVFAAFDELHQLYVPDRSGQLSDVLLDSVSALVGIGACWLLGWYNKRS